MNIVQSIEIIEHCDYVFFAYRKTKPLDFKWFEIRKKAVKKLRLNEIKHLADLAGKDAAK